MLLRKGLDFLHRALYFIPILSLFSQLFLKDLVVLSMENKSFSSAVFVESAEMASPEKRTKNVGGENYGLCVSMANIKGRH